MMCHFIMIPSLTCWWFGDETVDTWVPFREGAHEATSHGFSCTGKQTNLSSFVSINKHFLWGFQTKNCEAFCVSEGHDFLDSGTGWQIYKCFGDQKVYIYIHIAGNCCYDTHGYHYCLILVVVVMAIILLLGCFLNPVDHWDVLNMNCFFLDFWTINSGTLPETNISPEKRPLVKEIPIGNHHF